MHDFWSRFGPLTRPGTLPLIDETLCRVYDTLLDAFLRPSIWVAGLGSTTLSSRGRIWSGRTSPCQTARARTWSAGRARQRLHSSSSPAQKTFTILAVHLLAVDFWLLAFSLPLSKPCSLKECLTQSMQCQKSVVYAPALAYPLTVLSRSGGTPGACCTDARPSTASTSRACQTLGSGGTRRTRPLYGGPVQTPADPDAPFV